MRRGLQRLVCDERGAMALVALFMGVFLVGALYYLVGIGDALLYRERMQDAADAAAFSSAVMHARGMNLIALANMIMAALLAVLVALKLVELLATLAMLACVLAAFFVPGVAGLLPGLQTVRTGVAKAHTAVQPTVMTGIELLHVAGKSLRVFIPAASQGVTLALVKNYYDPPASFGFVVPTRATLPTRDDTYGELCSRAAGYVSKLVMLPFEPFRGAPGGGEVLGVVEDAVADLLGSSPGWFCKANGERPEIRVNVTRRYPLSESASQCAATELGRPTLPADAQAACNEAEAERARTLPDEKTGECGPDCDPAAYEARAALGRTQCDPNNDKELRDYEWQERDVSMRYDRKTKRWAYEWTSAPRLVASKRPPKLCERLSKKLPLRLKWDWNPREQDEAGMPLPVCRSGLVHRGDGSFTTTEVLRVFKCGKQEEYRRAPEDLTQDPDLGGNRGGSGDTSRSPQTMEDGLQRGHAAFQLRSVIVGRPPRTLGGRALAAATWVKGEPSSALDALRVLGQFQVAQAEYYFADAHKPPKEWLWNMCWKARLRRVRWQAASPGQPQAPAADEDFGIQPPLLDVQAACGAANTLGSSLHNPCGELELAMPKLLDLLVH